MTTIYIIDDHPIVHRGLTSVINSTPRLKVAGSSSDINVALSQVKHCKPSIVLLDIYLSGQSGLDYIEPLKALSPISEVVMYSSESRPLIVQRALNSGAKGFVVKTDGLQAILDCVQSVKKGLTYFSDSIQLLQDEAGKEYPRLTPKESEVISLYAKCNSSLEVARQLNVKPGTIKVHLRSMRKKYSVRNSSGVVRIARDLGYIAREE